MFESLTAAIDELSELEPQALGDAETVVELHRLRNRLDALVTRAVAAFDASGAWAPDGAQTCAAWLMTDCRLPEAVARSEVSDGRALRAMPRVEEAFVEGEISRCHVAALRRARAGCEEAFETEEKRLVDDATCLRYSHFARTLTYWRQRVDREAAEDDYQAAVEQRKLHLSQSFGDMWFLDGTGDPVSGAVVYAELKRLEQRCFEADWASAKERLGRDPLLDELGRSPAQRRWDALVEMATRSASTAPGSRRPEPLFVVHCDKPTFTGMLCELADGTVVPPGALVPWLVEGWIERIVFDGTGRVIDVGPRRRIFSGATREAIFAAQRECYHPYCERRAEDCQADHITESSKGGLTVQDNGRPACGFHNRLRNRRREPPPA